MRRLETFVHPLRDFALELMSETDGHDAITLGALLAGAFVLGKRGQKINEAYRIVAADILLYLEREGTLRRDASGWLWSAEMENPPQRLLVAPPPGVGF
jgi:hypothetical protein